MTRAATRTETTMKRNLDVETELGRDGTDLFTKIIDTDAHIEGYTVRENVFVHNNVRDKVLVHNNVLGNVHNHNNIHGEIPDNVCNNLFDNRLNETPPIPGSPKIFNSLETNNFDPPDTINPPDLPDTKDERSPD